MTASWRKPIPVDVEYRMNVYMEMLALFKQDGKWSDDAADIMARRCALHLDSEALWRELLTRKMRFVRPAENDTTWQGRI